MNRSLLALLVFNVLFFCGACYTQWSYYVRHEEPWSLRLESSSAHVSSGGGDGHAASWAATDNRGSKASRYPLAASV